MCPALARLTHTLDMGRVGESESGWWYLITTESAQEQYKAQISLPLSSETIKTNPIVFSDPASRLGSDNPEHLNLTQR